jgi:oxygen-independent coproporphyrinogen-3 oxidase
METKYRNCTVFGIPHISSYALIEPKTALNKLIQTGKIAALKMK